MHCWETKREQLTPLILNYGITITRSSFGLLSLYSHIDVSTKYENTVAKDWYVLARIECSPSKNSTAFEFMRFAGRMRKEK